MLNTGLGLLDIARTCNKINNIKFLVTYNSNKLFFSVSFICYDFALGCRQGWGLHDMPSHFTTLIDRAFWDMFFPEYRAQEQKSRWKHTKPLKYWLGCGIHSIPLVNTK